MLPKQHVSGFRIMALAIVLIALAGAATVGGFVGAVIGVMITQSPTPILLATVIGAIVGVLTGVVYAQNPVRK